MRSTALQVVSQTRSHLAAQRQQPAVPGPGARTRIASLRNSMSSSVAGYFIGPHAHPRNRQDVPRTLLTDRADTW